jgi:hypothetical protein
LQKLLSFLPDNIANPAVAWSQRQGLRLLLWFYGRADTTLAPTVPQVQWLGETLKKPCFLMPRGVDGELFKHRSCINCAAKLNRRTDFI